MPVTGAHTEPAEISIKQKTKTDNPPGSHSSLHFVEADSSCIPTECFLIKKPQISKPSWGPLPLRRGPFVQEKNLVEVAGTWHLETGK